MKKILLVCMVIGMTGCSSMGKNTSLQSAMSNVDIDAGKGESVVKVCVDDTVTMSGESWRCQGFSLSEEQVYESGRDFSYYAARNWPESFDERKIWVGARAERKKGEVRANWSIFMGYEKLNFPDGEVHAPVVRFCNDIVSNIGASRTEGCFIQVKIAE